jgi:hypothetical protein
MFNVGEAKSGRMRSLLVQDLRIARHRAVVANQSAGYLDKKVTQIHRDGPLRTLTAFQALPRE